MAGLTAVGTLSYNGYTFDGASTVKVKTKYIYDEAQRTVLYAEFTITVAAIISPSAGSTTDNDMNNIHARLSKPGGILVFRNRGFGSRANINAGNVRDVKWGPKPQILEWESVGSSAACSVIWSVVVCVPQCADAGYKGVMAMNYEVDYNYDEHGDCTRIISGYLEIAQTWQGNARPGSVRIPPDSVDRYRRMISPNWIKGYMRTHDWKLSKDRSRINFTITDRQIPTRNAYPRGMTAVRGSHSQRWSAGKGRAGFSFNTISMELTPGRGVSPAQAWLIFLTLVQQRTDLSKQAKTAPFLMELAAEEDIWGRACSFSCTYRLTGQPGNFLYNSGQWTPLGTDWTAWLASVTQIYTQRGNDGLMHNPSEDAIVDLCGGEGSNSQSQNTPINENPPVKKPYLVKNNLPDSKQSYLNYMANLKVARSYPYIRHQILQEPSRLTEYEASIGNMRNKTVTDYLASNGTPDVIQQRGQPAYEVTFTGSAVRAGYPIPRPALVTVGNQAAVEKEGEFHNAIVANAMGVSVYAAAWNIKYLMADLSGIITPPSKVDEGIDGTTGSVAIK